MIEMRWYYPPKQPGHPREPPVLQYRYRTGHKTVRSSRPGYYQFETAWSEWAEPAFYDGDWDIEDKPNRKAIEREETRKAKKHK